MRYGRRHRTRCGEKKCCVIYGAEEGTRTPTPLRVHGPEPCASANSATSATVLVTLNCLSGRTEKYFTGVRQVVKSGFGGASQAAAG